MWKDICTYLIIIFIMLMLIYFKNYIRSVYLAFQLPGPPAVPFLGNVLLMKDDRSKFCNYIFLYFNFFIITEMEELAERMSELYSPFMRVWLSIIPFFFIYEPKALQIALGTSRYTTKNIFYNFLHNVIGDGLITSSGKLSHK